MSYDNIPSELKALNQWIVWRLEDIGAKKPTKVPYSSITGRLASVSDPSDWCSFEEAVKKSPNYSGIGFVFAEENNLTFIDLDDAAETLSGPNPNYQADFARQLKIFKEFDSYSEVSPSGKGLHVIVKGKVPSGRRRNFIEVYSSLRYATFTGNVYHDKPIIDCQEKLTQLWEQMGNSVATHLYQGDAPEKDSDAYILNKATNAVNGEKFKALLEGKWQDIYPSQSEADISFINIIAFYSQNRNQIERIFKASPLGKRDKARRKDYVSWMINKSFDQILPQIDFDGFKNALEAKVAQQELPLDKVIKQEIIIPPVAAKPSLSAPPGLLGEIAHFIYQAAPRPVPEIALAGAIGLMAGITGRAYNVSNTGLNHYILMLASTGNGKEAMAYGIDKLMNTIRLQVPTSPGFIGPSEIASGQALVKHLNKTSQCFVSILGEFGYRLESMSNPNSNSAEKTLKRMLLDLFNKSGHGQVFRPTIFADSDKNINATEAPAFSVLAESTPETFFSILNDMMIADGLLPRFIFIEYTGPRPALNKGFDHVQPTMALVDKLASLVANVEMIMHAKRVINVQQTPDAMALTDSLDKLADAQINNSTKEVVKQLWNRAHIKVLKLSALIAVGVNMIEPLITADHVRWAMDIVKNDIHSLSEKFEQGLIGASTQEIKQGNYLIRMIKEFIAKDWDYCSKYCQGKNMRALHHDKIIPYAYLNKRLSPASSYRLDKQGSTVALKRAIQIMLDSDRLKEIGKSELALKYGTTQRSFMINDLTMLD